MNKQRLLELAGINEVKYYRDTGKVYVVVEMMDYEPTAWGPFTQEDLAKKFREAIIEKHEIEPETLFVVQVFHPDLGIGD